MTKAQEKNNGQIVVTIPRELADAMNIEQGTEIDWSVASGSALRAEIQD